METLFIYLRKSKTNFAKPIYFVVILLVILLPTNSNKAEMKYLKLFETYAGNVMLCTLKMFWTYIFGIVFSGDKWQFEVGDNEGTWLALSVFTDGGKHQNILCLRYWHFSLRSEYNMNQIHTTKLNIINNIICYMLIHIKTICMKWVYTTTTRGFK